MKKISFLYIAIFFFLLITACQMEKEPEFRYFPELPVPKHLVVIDEEDMTPEEMVAVTTLQGIVAKEKPEIYITNVSYEKWLKDLSENYGVTLEKIKDPWKLIERYRDRINGYIEYENYNPSVNVATSVAGPENAIALETGLTAKAQMIGLSKIMDVKDKYDDWTYNEYKDQLSDRFIVQQDPAKPHLRDFGVAHNAMFIYDMAPEEAGAILSHGGSDIPRLGWGPGDEFSHVGLASYFSKFTVPSDWALNLTVFSGVKVENPFKQKYRVKATEKRENEHYVSFLMSDGDNVQWMLNSFTQNPKWYGSSERGAFPIGWQIPPLLSDLAPSVLKWIYDYAEKDYFVAGVSGNGYFYPSKYPEEAMSKHMERLDSYMKLLDLEVAAILDEKQTRPDVLQKYAEMSSLKGAVLYWGRYYLGGGGQIIWVNDKPFVTIRESLWETDPAAMAERINGYPKDPASADGYTLVNVHPWSHSLEDVETVIKHLQPHVKVISPEEMFERIIRDVERSE